MSTLTDKTGLHPGALVHVGERKIEKTRIRLIDYNVHEHEENEYETIEECFPFRDRKSVTWINIDGLHDVDLIGKLGEHYKIHPLVLEDILNTEQRPKVEYYEDYIFIVLKMIYFDDESGSIFTEQLSIILKGSTVLTFQERVGDIFNPVRKRIENSIGRIRNVGADYLAYALMDALIDNYFITVDKFADFVDDLEEELVTEPTRDTLNNIYRLKKEILYLSRYVRPVREVVSQLSRDESQLIDKSNEPYFRDLYDHVIQVVDMIDIFRELVAGMLDTYLSVTSNRMNEVMKVLTIMASIFIPLTFLAGIYGMNFDMMPELHWYWGYPIVLVSMIVIAVVMITYFRKRNWI